MQIKHIGRGNYSWIDDDGNRVGPVGKREDVEKWVAPSAEDPGSEPVQTSSVVQPMAIEIAPNVVASGAKVDVQAYERMLSGLVRRETDKLGSAVIAALTPHVGEDTAKAMVSRMEPILRDPMNQARRRRMMQE